MRNGQVALEFMATIGLLLAVGSIFAYVSYDWNRRIFEQQDHSEAGAILGRLSLEAASAMGAKSGYSKGFYLPSALSSGNLYYILSDPATGTLEVYYRGASVSRTFPYKPFQAANLTGGHITISNQGGTIEFS